MSIFLVKFLFIHELYRKKSHLRFIFFIDNLKGVHLMSFILNSCVTGGMQMTDNISIWLCHILKRSCLKAVYSAVYSCLFLFSQTSTSEDIQIDSNSSPSSVSFYSDPENQSNDLNYTGEIKDLPPAVAVAEKALITMLSGSAAGFFIAPSKVLILFKAPKEQHLTGREVSSPSVSHNKNPVFHASDYKGDPFNGNSNENYTQFTSSSHSWENFEKNTKPAIRYLSHRWLELGGYITKEITRFPIGIAERVFSSVLEVKVKNESMPFLTLTDTPLEEGDIYLLSLSSHGLVIQLRGLFSQQPETYSQLFPETVSSMFGLRKTTQQIETEGWYFNIGQFIPHKWQMWSLFHNGVAVNSKGEVIGFISSTSLSNKELDRLVLITPKMKAYISDTLNEEDKQIQENEKGFCFQSWLKIQSTK